MIAERCAAVTAGRPKVVRLQYAAIPIRATPAMEGELQITAGTSRN